jgi:hypothetical protein
LDEYENDSLFCTALFSLVEIYWCFGSEYCLHYQGNELHNHSPYYGYSTHLWNVHLLQQDCTELYPRRLSYSV